MSPFGRLAFAAVVPVLAGLAMLVNGASITGPFIFGDEALYITYARDLSRGSLAGHTQYGVVYPAIGSILFHFGSAESVYAGLRFFNVVAFVSSAIPAFLLARTMFPDDGRVPVLFAAFAATVPFTAFAYVIWADPLYYALVLWAAYFLFRFSREPTMLWSVLAGSCFGLLFPVKPGAGLVAAAAAVVSVAAFVAMAPRTARMRLLGLATALALAMAAMSLPWIVRNLVLDAGLVGYKTQFFSNRLSLVGGVRIAQEMALCTLYQLAYIFIATFGLLAVVVALPLARWSSLSIELRTLVVFNVTWISGVVAISAVGMTSYGGVTYLGYWMPNGRYLGVTIPLTVLIAARLLLLEPHPTRREIAAMVGTSAVFAVVLAVATPLLVFAPYSFVNNPDLALAIWVVDKGMVVWRALYEPSLGQVIGFAMIFGACGAVAAFLSRSRGAVVAGLACAVVANIAISAAAHRYVRILGESQAAQNDVMRYLHGNGIDLDAVAFDCKLQGSNLDFMARVWVGRGIGRNCLSSPEAAGNSPRFFVSPEELALPVAFKAKSTFVYALPSLGGKP